MEDTYANSTPDFITPIAVFIIVPFRLRFIVTIPDINSGDDDISLRDSRLSSSVHGFDGSLVVNGFRPLRASTACACCPDYSAGVCLLDGGDEVVDCGVFDALDYGFAAEGLDVGFLVGVSL